MATKLVSGRSEVLREQLKRIMERPQRHRLLHGYPLAAAMHYLEKSKQQLVDLIANVNSRGPAGNSLLVGILPHPFCNPKIAGCGFCTFPHEFYSAAKSEAVAMAVVQEMKAFVRHNPLFVKARPNAIYFGGGTANLTPPAGFLALCETLRNTFDVTQAEVSLEGVPSRFLQGQRKLIELMRDELPARHFRISMGIQSFAEHRLKMMGRTGFGNAETFRHVVDYAHQRGLTTSGDLLFNQPLQDISEMLEDVDRAIDIGLDQICLYHLVLFQGLGTEWSHKPELVANLPSNTEAAENWNILRLYLIQNGYVQTSLTNFERQDIYHSDRRYQYESISFEDSRCQVVGFGPSGISFAQSNDGLNAIKTMNPEHSAEYMQAVQAGGVVCNRYFQYQSVDLEILDLTRKMASLSLARDAFESRFGKGRWQSYQELFDLFCVEDLLAQYGTSFRLTSKGMFYSDSMSSLLAMQRWQQSPRAQVMSTLNDNRAGHM
jgi:coproporphyrinogen III oxidase-like Fe-S oxidoreductase